MINIMFELNGKYNTCKVFSDNADDTAIQGSLG